MNLTYAQTVSCPFSWGCGCTSRWGGPSRWSLLFAKGYKGLSSSCSEHSLPPLAGALLVAALILGAGPYGELRGQQCRGAQGSKNRAEDRAGLAPPCLRPCPSQDNTLAGFKQVFSKTGGGGKRLSRKLGFGGKVVY